MKFQPHFHFSRQVCTVLTAMSIALAGQVATAAGYSKNFYSDHATVTHVVPIYRTVRISDPQRECHSEQVYHSSGHSHGHSAGSTIAGGIIGGVIGHQIGKRFKGGHGKHGGAILGTLVGAAIGHDESTRRHSRHKNGYTTIERHCETVNAYYTEERIDAYRVTYEYNGEVFHARMKHRPGDRIRVKIHVTPGDY